MQTSYTQQTIEVASIMSLVCHNEACQRTKLLFPKARVRDEHRLEPKICAVAISRRGGAAPEN